MATLHTRDGKTREFAEVWIQESGTHLCYEGPRDDGADAALVVPATTVNRVEPDDGVAVEHFAVHEMAGAGQGFPDQQVVRARNVYAEAIYQEVRVR